MQRSIKILEVGAIVVGLSVATLAARQVIQTSDIRIGGPGGAGPLFGGAPADTKPLTTGTGMMLGVVQDAASRRGVAGAIVTLALPGFAPAQIMADAEGRFAFLNLPTGRFNLTATRPGYADGTFGRTRPSGPGVALDLSDGEKAGDVVIPVWKHASITGSVTDENNEPIVGANVRVIRRTVIGGKRVLTAGPSDTTDDRGLYRIGSLEPGDYIVALPMTMPGGGSPLDRLLGGGGAGGGGAMTFSISMSTSASGGSGSMSTSIGDLLSPADASAAGLTEDGHLLVFPTQFYPTAASPARATLLTVQSGEERSGIDLQLRPVRTARVSGTVSGPEGPAANISLTLSPADTDDLVSPVGSLTTSSDGSGQFNFRGVPTGAYTLRASRSPNIRIQSDAGGGGGMVVMRSISMVGGGGPLPADSNLWAETNLTIGTADVTDLSLGLRPGMKLTGTVAFSGGKEKPAADRIAAIAVTLEPADARSASATSTVRGKVETNGQFVTMAVPPGKFVLRVGNLPAGWALLNAMAGGQDITDEPLELTTGDATGVVITLTDQPTEITGVVTSAAGGPDTGAAVIAFPTDNTAWVGRGTNPRRIRTVRPSKDGTFTFSNLPPGNYFIGAVPDVTAPDWQDPRFLDALSRSAARVLLGPGEKKSQNVQTAPVR
jgi:hypothetical protein